MSAHRIAGSTIAFVLCVALVAHAQVTQVGTTSHTISVTQRQGPSSTTPTAISLDVANPLTLVGNRSARLFLHPPAYWGAFPLGIVTAIDSGDLPGLYGGSMKGAGVMGVSALAGGIPADFYFTVGGSGVYGENNLYRGIGVLAQADSGYGVSGFSATLVGVVGQSGGQGLKTGVTESDDATPTGVRGIGVGSAQGVVGISASGNGVRGTSATGYGVSGEGGDIGVYAHNTTTPHNTVYLATRGLAGDFYGDVYIHGTLTKSAGSFRIDHPLDPAHKYLFHSFVESPDMLDIYNGEITLDSTGQAVVELPAWFEALNKDFRYQLTAIGAPAPNLYIAREVTANRFVIAGGSPGVRVSWQVTGIRHDAYANAHRIPVEQEKADTSAAER